MAGGANWRELRAAERKEREKERERGKKKKKIKIRFWHVSIIDWTNLK